MIWLRVMDKEAKVVTNFIGELIVADSKGA